jgi:hypothetical protein
MIRAIPIRILRQVLLVIILGTIVFSSTETSVLSRLGRSRSEFPNLGEP